jgi:hypothetical protein
MFSGRGRYYKPAATYGVSNSLAIDVLLLIVHPAYLAIMRRNYEYEIFGNHHQPYPQCDDELFGDLYRAWAVVAVDRLLAAASHVICVGT